MALLYIQIFFFFNASEKCIHGALNIYIYFHSTFLQDCNTNLCIMSVSADYEFSTFIVC